MPDQFKENKPSKIQFLEVHIADLLLTIKAHKELIKDNTQVAMIDLRRTMVNAPEMGAPNSWIPRLQKQLGYFEELYRYYDTIKIKWSKEESKSKCDCSAPQVVFML